MKLLHIKPDLSDEVVTLDDAKTYVRTIEASHGEDVDIEIKHYGINGYQFKIVAGEKTFVHYLIVIHEDMEDEKKGITLKNYYDPVGFFKQATIT